MSAIKETYIKSNDRTWEKVVKGYNQPVLSKSIWQIINSVIPLFLAGYLMYLSLDYSYLLAIIPGFFAVGFLIRIFIIFHDCGHGSFFKSAKANNLVGIFAGVLTSTPYRMWHHQHRIHHASAVNLDKRGIGDVWTMTKEEYINASQRDRLIYRLFRNPFLMFTVGPIMTIFFANRFSNRRMNREDKVNLYFTNFLVIKLAVSLALLIGVKAYLLIYLPVLLVAHAIGIWLFLIQHNFEEIEWERNADWDYKKAAMKGCSFLKFPLFFQWFTGNIGFHHVHHLSPRIPNYNLAKCHYENELFKEIRPIRFFQTFKYLKLHLWDEQNQKMISFRDLKVFAISDSVNKTIKQAV